MPGDKGLWP